MAQRNVYFVHNDRIHVIPTKFKRQGWGLVTRNTYMRIGTAMNISRQNLQRAFAKEHPQARFLPRGANYYAKQRKNKVIRHNSLSKRNNGFPKEPRYDQFPGKPSLLYYDWTYMRYIAKNSYFNKVTTRANTFLNQTGSPRTCALYSLWNQRYGRNKLGYLLSHASAFRKADLKDYSRQVSAQRAMRRKQDELAEPKPINDPDHVDKITSFIFTLRKLPNVDHKKVLKMAAALPPDEISGSFADAKRVYQKAMPSSGERTLNRDNWERDRKLSEQQIRKLQHQGMHLVSFTSRNYPENDKTSLRTPAVLAVEGDPKNLNQPSIFIHGPKQYNLNNKGIKEYIKEINKRGFTPTADLSDGKTAADIINDTIELGSKVNAVDNAARPNKHSKIAAQRAVRSGGVVVHDCSRDPHIASLLPVGFTDGTIEMCRWPYSAPYSAAKNRLRPVIRAQSSKSRVKKFLNEAKKDKLQRSHSKLIPKKLQLGIAKLGAINRGKAVLAGNSIRREANAWRRHVQNKEYSNLIISRAYAGKSIKGKYNVLVDARKPDGTPIISYHYDHRRHTLQPIPYKSYNQIRKLNYNIPLKKKDLVSAYQSGKPLIDYNYRDNEPRTPKGLRKSLQSNPMQCRARLFPMKSFKIRGGLIDHRRITYPNRVISTGHSFFNAKVNNLKAEKEQSLKDIESGKQINEIKRSHERKNPGSAAGKDSPGLDFP